jgi:5-methylcytosine-specific restriction enzyme subunit McrC
VLRCERLDARTASVRVADAVGLIAIPGLELHIRPKIPTEHLLHLLRAGQTLPRFASQSGSLQESSTNLAVLVAHWYTVAVERLLQQGLARGYREDRDEIHSVRGRIDPIGTARLYYRGRPLVVADFEQFDIDMPLNRVLLHAARLLARAPALPADIRRRALRATHQLDRIGDLRADDLQAQPDRATTYYGDAVSLAHQVISASGRTLGTGHRKSWSFLLATPRAVEEGIRQTLTEGLRGISSVRKRSVALGGAPMTVNPDLVFGDDGAVADVKYKVGTDEWVRSDLYEVVAFAAAIRTIHAAIVTFRDGTRMVLDDVAIGDYGVHEMHWPISASIAPAEAAESLVGQARVWLARMPTPTLGARQ